MAHRLDRGTLDHRARRRLLVDVNGRQLDILLLLELGWLESDLWSLIFDIRSIIITDL